MTICSGESEEWTGLRFKPWPKWNVITGFLWQEDALFGRFCNETSRRDPTAAFWISVPGPEP